MTFADLVVGDSVFVDANTLIYHCTIDPTWGPACTNLLDRVGLGELTAFTSTHILLEVCHRLMALEAARILGKPQGPVVKFLKGHLDEVRRLTGFRQAIDDLCIGQLRLLTISPALVPTIAALSQQIGLLTNDAAVVALMQANGLSKIASLDADFDRVPGSRAAPRRNHPAGRPGAGRCQPLTGGVSQPEAEMGPGAMRRLASSLPTPSSFKPVAQERWPGCPLGLWAGPSPWSARSNRARMASPPA